MRREGKVAGKGRGKKGRIKVFWVQVQIPHGNVVMFYKCTLIKYIKLWIFKVHIVNNQIRIQPN